MLNRIDRMFFVFLDSFWIFMIRLVGNVLLLDRIYHILQHPSSAVF